MAANTSKILEVVEKTDELLNQSYSFSGEIEGRVFDESDFELLKKYVSEIRELVQTDE